MRVDVLALLLLAGCDPSGEVVMGIDPDDTTQPGDTDDTGTPPATWAVGTARTQGEGSEGVTLPLQVWYPTLDEGAPHVYEPGHTGEAVDGGEAACATPRPVVVFSHGTGMFRYQSTFLTEALAARGYVVVAPDHVGDTRHDGGLLPTGPILIRRPIDVRDAFDLLVASAEEPAAPWRGCVDPADGYAVVGHSLGATTTLAVAGAPLDLDGLALFCLGAPAYFLCPAVPAWHDRYPDDPSGDLSDPRVWAAAALAPAGVWGFGDHLEAIEVPTLVLGGTWDTVTPWSTEVAPIHARLAAPRRALGGLIEAGHLAFTDFCASGLDGCNAWNMPVETVHALTAPLVASWLDATRGAGPWPSAPPPVHMTWTATDP